MTDRGLVLAKRFKATHPRFNIVKRSDSKFLSAIFWPLKKITGKTYNNFSTTIFSTVYVPDDWDLQPECYRYEILRHEITHVRQANELLFPSWLWPVNCFLFALAYLLCFPIIFTMRAKFEREGYTQSMLVLEERRRLDEQTMVNWMVPIFAGNTYLWMWRKVPAGAWVRKTVADIKSGKIVNTQDFVAA